METNQIILSLILIIGLYCLYYTQKRNKEYKDFHSYVTPNDPVNFYINEEKFKGTLIEYGERVCTIKEWGGDKVKVLTSDMYPIWGHDYKAGKS